MNYHQTTQQDHAAIVRAAVRNFDMNPYRLIWHYVLAALHHHHGNVSATSEALGLERRSVRRIASKKEPPQRVAATLL